MPIPRVLQEAGPVGGAVSGTPCGSSPHPLVGLQMPMGSSGYSFPTPSSLGMAGQTAGGARPGGALGFKLGLLLMRMDRLAGLFLTLTKRGRKYMDQV